MQELLTTKYQPLKLSDFKVNNDSIALIRSLISCILVVFSVQYFNLSDDINSLIKDFRTNYFKI